MAAEMMGFTMSMQVLAAVRVVLTVTTTTSPRTLRYNLQIRHAMAMMREKCHESLGDSQNTTYVAISLAYAALF